MSSDDSSDSERFDFADLSKFRLDAQSQPYHTEGSLQLDEEPSGHS